MTYTAGQSSPCRAAALRSGSAYIYFLGISLIVTVLGLGALAVSRTSAKVAAAGNDWEAAGTLAFSATEHAISVINTAAAASPNTWRSGYTSGVTAFSQSMGRGTMSWALKDEVDGNLQADYLRAFRIYGIGKVGSVTRVYSVQVLPGGSPLDVLRTAIHSGPAMKLTGTPQAINGPFSTNAAMTLAPNTAGNVEAASMSGGGSTTGTITAPAPAKTMPLSTIGTNLAINATAINFSGLSGGKITNCLLSAASNPYGSPNTAGLYSISIGNGTLKVTNCRIVGTLLVTGTSGAKVQITGPVEWEPGPTNAPIVVVTGPNIDVTLAGSSTWLSESTVGVNLNPPSTPYAGSSNTTTTDDFPPQYHGVIHVITGSAGSLSTAGNAYVVGTVIADCPTQTNSQCTFVQDPSIYASPPYGYAVGDAMIEQPGTWRWDTLP